MEEFVIRKQVALPLTHKHGITPLQNIIRRMESEKSMAKIMATRLDQEIDREILKQLVKQANSNLVNISPTVHEEKMKSPLFWVDGHKMVSVRY